MLLRLWSMPSDVSCWTLISVRVNAGELVDWWAPCWPCPGRIKLTVKYCRMEGMVLPVSTEPVQAFILCTPGAIFNRDVLFKLCHESLVCDTSVCDTLGGKDHTNCLSWEGLNFSNSANTLAFREFGKSKKISLRIPKHLLDYLLTAQVWVEGVVYKEIKILILLSQ